MNKMLPTRSAHREALMKEQQLPVPSTPVLSIRGYLCARCFRHTENLSACSGCKRATYCSKECQKMDWNIQHKKKCKILKELNKRQAERTPPRSWLQYRDQLFDEALHLRDTYGDRELSNLIQGQPYCTTCYRSAPQVTSALLKPCSSCHLIFTCSTCKTSHSTKECKEYQLYVKEELFILESFEKFGKVTTQFPTDKPRSTYKPLSSAANWFEYYTQISDKTMIEVFVRPDFTFMDEMADKIPDMSANSTESLWLALRFATETSSMPLTILAALEDCIPDIAQKDKLNIHLLGCNARELLVLGVFEEIQHLLPALKELNSCLIGPNTWVDIPLGTVKPDMPLESCDICKSQGRKKSLALYRGLYHDYATTSHYSKPDLAVLFHSGRSQEAEESWAPTTRFLVSSETLTLCTTYNEREMVEEVAELESLGAKLVVRPTENKWRSLSSRLDLLEETEHKRFYQDYFRYIFQGRV